MLLPPDFQRTTFLGMIPYTLNEDTSLVVAFASGEIYELDLESESATALHVANDLQASLLNAPSTYISTLNSFTIAGPQNTLYTHAQDGFVYFVSLSDDPTVRSWAKRSVSAAAVQARFIIPLTSQHSTDIINIYDNTYVTMHNLFYNSSIGLGTFVGKPTTVLYTDMMSRDSSGNIFIQDLLLVGGDTGIVTLFVELAGVSTTSPLGSAGGKVGQILHYRSPQKNSYIIFNTFDSTTAANNRILFVDLNNNRATRTFTTSANNITLFSDALLHDWVIFSNSSGIYKLDLTEFNTTSPFIPIQISAGFNAYSSSTNPILSLQPNYIQILDPHTDNLVRTPCLIAVSAQGMLSIMRGDTWNWQEIGTPLELASIGNTIVAASVVQSSTTALTSQLFSIIAVLDDGAIVTRSVPELSFLAGIYDNIDERVSVQQSSIAPINTTHGAFSTKALSYLQLKALVEEDRPIILTFQDNNHNPVQYRLIGFDEETNPRRHDSPKLILQLAQTLTNAETLQKHNLGFFPALLEAIEIAYEVCLIGADLWDIGTQLYYTATTIYDTIITE